MVFDRVSSNVKNLSITFAIGHFGSSTMWLFLPVFFRMYIDNLFLIGLLTSIPALVNLILDIPVGNLIQRASSRLVMLIGLAAFALPGVIYFTALPFLFFVGKILEGISKTLRWESGWYMAMSNSKKENEAETLSVFELGKSMSDIIGPMIGGVVAFYLGFRYNLIIWSLFGFLAFTFFYFSLGYSTKNFKNAFHSLFKRKTYFDDWKHLKENWSGLGWSVSLILLHALIYSFFWVSVPLLLEELGANYLLMGLIFGTIAIPRLFQIYFSEIADRYGWLKTIFWLTFFIIPVLFIMSTIDSILLLGGFILLANLLTAALSPTLHSYYDASTSDDLEGEMVGFLEFFKHSGQSLGPLIAGTVASIWSISASFIAAAFIAIVMCLAVTYIRLSKE